MLILFVSFFTRKIFLDKLGIDFLGLTGTLGSLLGFLNLAELGIGSAIGYVLYKPIFDKDESKLNEIISVFGYIYRLIGIVIICGGIILSAFLPFIFKDITIDLGVVYYVYYSFLLSSMLGYFVNYKQSLLHADQKGYLVTGYMQTASIAKTILQASLAYYTQNYYIWATNEIIFGVIFSLILSWQIRKTYPWLASDIRLGKGLLRKYPDVFKYTKQIFVHKMSSFVTLQTAPLLIYSFASLSSVTLYGNYTLITTRLTTLVAKVIDSGQASIGSIIAEGNTLKAYNIFRELYAFRIFVASIIVYMTYSTIDDFIVLWLGEEYLMHSSTVVILLIIIFIGQMGSLYGQFLFGFGLFHDVWAPVAESIIYIAIAIIGGYFMGLNGILLGHLISNFTINAIWKPIFLFSKGFKLPQRFYWVDYGVSIFVLILIMVFMNWLYSNFIEFIDPTNNYIDWALNAACEFVLFSLILYIALFATNKGMRDISTRMIRGVRLKLK